MKECRAHTSKLARSLPILTSQVSQLAFPASSYHAMSSLSCAASSRRSVDAPDRIASRELLRRQRRDQRVNVAAAV